MHNWDGLNRTNKTIYINTKKKERDGMGHKDNNFLRPLENGSVGEGQKLSLRGGPTPYRKKPREGSFTRVSTVLLKRCPPSRFHRRWHPLSPWSPLGSSQQWQILAGACAGKPVHSFMQKYWEYDDLYVRKCFIQLISLKNSYIG